MKKLLSLTVLVLLVVSCGTGQNKTRLDQTRLFQLKQYLVTNGRSPVEYVIDKFNDHDVIFLGEPHRLKDHPVLVKDLIPHLYDNGVYTLATEFACKVDQPLIDSLLRGEEYDDAMARHIQMRQFSGWPWQEYLDIYKAAWALNQSLPDTARAFRILGMGCDLDWTAVETEEDFQDWRIRKKVWKGCSEKDWADVIMGPVSEGEKVLVYCGSHHAFTRYRQPVANADGEFIRFGDVRAGNYVYEEIGDRCLTIYLHGPWFDRKSQNNDFGRRPIAGAVDQVMTSQGTEAGPVGFDVVGTPFGKLTDDNAIYAVGYDSFTLADFCDGYIWFRPWSELETVTFADGFYNEDNIALARVRTPQPSYRDADPAYFESRMRRQVAREASRYHGL